MPKTQDSFSGSIESHMKVISIFLNLTFHLDDNYSKDVDRNQFSMLSGLTKYIYIYVLKDKLNLYYTYNYNLYRLNWRIIGYDFPNMIHNSTQFITCKVYLYKLINLYTYNVTYISYCILIRIYMNILTF